MLKKGQPVNFTRPVSTMRTILASVEQGLSYQRDIVEETGLRLGQVRSALYNLTFIGAIERHTDTTGRTVYIIPGRQYGIAPCLLGVRSIFDVR